MTAHPVSIARLPSLADHLAEAARSGKTDWAVRLVDELGVPVDSPSEPGRLTALMRAMANGHRDTACALLERCADPRKKDAYGNDALLWAERMGYPELAMMLRREL